MTHELIDIGVNLADSVFATDLNDVIQHAREAGVQQMVVTGTNLPETQAAIELCQQHGPGLWCTAGVHPHYAKEWTPDHTQQLTRLAEASQVVAIGETGLDFNRNYSPPDQQRHAFEQQLKLAAETGLPLFLHERDAHDAQIDLLRQYQAHLHGGVIHCFTGTQAELENYLALDLYVGITGWICDERRGLHLRELVSLIPPDRLLLETDAPYLLPRTLKPKPKSRRNEPKHLAHIAEQVAPLLGLTTEALALQTTANAKRLFGL